MEISENRMSWRQYTSLILWGIVALSVFGCVASIMEYLRWLPDLLMNITGMFSGIGEPDVLEEMQSMLAVFYNSLRIVEILTLVGWLMYLYGVYKFRGVQPTRDTERLVGSVNTACWVGVVSVFLTFLSTIVWWIVALLFSIIAWILLLVSYCMFMGAFGGLRDSEDWDDRARRGAGNLRKSACYNIWLMVFPVVVFLVLLATVAVAWMDVKSQMPSSGFNILQLLYVIADTYKGVLFFEILVLCLTFLFLLVMQFVYRLLGWYRIHKGYAVVAEDEEGEETEGEEEESSYIDDEEDDDGLLAGRRKYVVGAIVAIAVLIGGIFLFSGDSQKPFLGTWQQDVVKRTEDGVVDAVYKYELHLDLYDRTVMCPDADSTCLGTICLYADAGGEEVQYKDVIVEAEILGDSAAIKYRHHGTGELWSAGLKYNEETKAVTFTNGVRIQSGDGGYDEEDVRHIEPETVTLNFVGSEPNVEIVDDSILETVEEEQEEEPDEEAPEETNTSVELADRIIYAERNEEGWQLYCRFKGSDDVVAIVNDEGESPIGIADYVLNIWPTDKGDGVLVVSEGGGTMIRYQFLYKVDADNRVECIDSAEGVNPGNMDIGPENITDDMVASIRREGRRIVVYNAQGEEGTYTHYYDMNGVRIAR